MRYSLLLTALALTLTAPTPSQAGPVIDWHDISSQSILTGGHPGATPILDFAVVHAAVHDAVQDEVKAIGSLNSTVRTDQQTGLAYFWADNFVAQFDRLQRSLAVAHLDDGDAQRMFALCWIAAADAFITTWDTKIHYVYWRPVTAIQEGNADGNPKTVGDANWKPLVNTPNYPDQSSGANALSSSVTTMLNRVFGTDDIPVTVTSNNPLANPNTRTYSSFSEVAAEVVEARIFQGIHFRFADTDARELGKSVAKSVYQNTLRPLGGGE